jgi:S-adenosylmethionine:tRNA ribosyltransferase-isomerase
MMIDAFVGPVWRDIYREAVERRYRFLSFGDAMLLDRHAHDH